MSDSAAVAECPYRRIGYDKNGRPTPVALSEAVARLSPQQILGEATLQLARYFGAEQEFGSSFCTATP